MVSTAVQEPKVGCLEGFESWLAEKHFGRERVEILILVCLIVYTAVFSYVSVYRHYAFNTHAWDLGIFTQSLWTTLNANHFLYYTCELVVSPGGSFFGVHFSPILGFILPIYQVFQVPETLLVIQSIVISLASTLSLSSFHLVRRSFTTRLPKCSCSDAVLVIVAAKDGKFFACTRVVMRGDIWILEVG